MTKPRVELEIACGDDHWGSILIELEDEKCPATVDNFLRYVEQGFFDGTIFHRVIPHFMIQGGGYTAPDVPKTNGLFEPINNEAASGIKNRRGTIAMARTAQPHSATSQFFINVADNDMLDHPGHDGWGYCAFGTVIEGMETVDRIKDVKTTCNPQMGEDSLPVDPPRIVSARRVA